MTQRTDTSGWPCSIARAVDVLGDGWTLLLVREACLGARRFEDFQRRLGIGRNILTRRLGQLVEDGLLAKVPYSERPLRHEYRLTEQGRDVFPILAAMAAWSDRWQARPEGSPLQLHHETCGSDVHASVVCGACGEPLALRETRARKGPGFDVALAAAREAGALPGSGQRGGGQPQQV